MTVKRKLKAPRILLAALIALNIIPKTKVFAQSSSSYVVGANQRFGITRDIDGYKGIGREYIDKIAQFSSANFSYTTDTPKELFERLLDGTVDIIPCVTERELERYEKLAKETAAGSRVSGTESSPSSVSEESQLRIVRSPLFSKFCTISINGNGIHKDLDFGDEYEIRKLNIGYLLDDEDDFFTNGVFVVNGLSRATYTSFASESAMQTALFTGKVDAVVKNCFMHWDGESIVYRFNTAPCYFVVRAQNQKLADELSSALDTMLDYFPSFTGEMHDKYITKYGSLSYSFTKNEALFIKDNPRLTIAYNLDADFAHCWDAGTATITGAPKRVFDELAKYSGFQIDVVGVNGLTQCIQMLRDGKVGAVYGGVSPDGITDYSGGLITSPAISSPLVLLGRQEDEPEKISAITMVGSNNTIKSALTLFYPNAKVTPFTSAEIASEQLMRKDSTYDAFCTGANTAIYLMCQPDTDLKLMRTLPVSVQECFAVNKLQPDLYNIIEKSLSQMNRGSAGAEMYNIINSLESAKPQDKSYLILNIIGFVILGIILVGYMIISTMENRHRAEVDNVTGGRNKRRFIKDTEKAARKNEADRLAVAVLDIDKFKFINERVGYDEGSRVLMRLHNTISDNVRKGEVFARIVNDSFAITMHNASDVELENRLSDIFTEFSRRNSLHISTPITFSAGICRLGECKVKGLPDPNTALDRCSLAKKTVKERRGNSVAFYDGKIRERELREKDYESEMPRALGNHEFSCFLQPKYGTKSRHIEGAEALIRWQSKEFGFVYPSDFIPLSEKNGFVVELDFFILEEVCRLMRKWLDSGLEPVIISVNQSRLHLDEPDYIGKLREIVDKYDIPYGYIELELTESVFTDNADLMIRTMQKLHDVGFKLSIDDFGSGYSSLNMLKDIPADVVKIDREFFNTTANTEKGRAVITSVVDLANNLNMKVISEGVETEEQVEFLADIGCHMVQGFFFAKPMTVNDFETLWEKDRTNPGD